MSQGNTENNKGILQQKCSGKGAEKQLPTCKKTYQNPAPLKSLILHRMCYNNYCFHYLQTTAANVEQLTPEINQISILSRFPIEHVPIWSHKGGRESRILYLFLTWAHFWHQGLSMGLQADFQQRLFDFDKIWGWLKFLFATKANEIANETFQYQVRETLCTSNKRQLLL